MIETEVTYSFDFDDLAKRLLDDYKSPLSQGLDPFHTFRRLNDTYRLCCHDNNTETFLQSFHEVLKSRIQSAILSGKSAGSGIGSSIHTENPFHDKRESSNLSELLLNIIQVEREGRRRNYKLDYSFLVEFDKRIRTNNGWIEKSYLDNINELSNTFFLPIIYEKVTSRADYFKNNSRNSEFSSNIFEHIFLELEKGPFARKEGSRASNYVRALDRHSPDLFDNIYFKALAAIHHEISENALSHAVSSKINHHFNSSTDKSDFGSIAYLKIQIFSLSKKINKEETFHPDFFSYHDEIMGGLHNFSLRKVLRRYMAISYGDTGLGIQDHLSKFGGEIDDCWSDKKIDEVIDIRATTRNFSGSGFGLRKTKKFAKQLRGFLSVDTPQSTYSYNGITGKSSENAGRTNRGTMISIVIPA